MPSWIEVCGRARLWSIWSRAPVAAVQNPVPTYFLSLPVLASQWLLQAYVCLAFFFSDSCRAFRIIFPLSIWTPKIFTCTIVQSWSGPSVNRIFRPACNCDIAWPHSVILAEVGRATCITISRVLNSGSFKTGLLMFLLCNRPWKWCILICKYIII